jgi:negative regulator of sigma E activity
MPQQSRPTGAVKGQKTTKVQRILEDESLRQSVEVVWKRERSQAESLGVLARAKALNEFIRKVSAVAAVCCAPAVIGSMRLVVHPINTPLFALPPHRVC